jgi:hypothetical protein
LTNIERALYPRRLRWLKWGLNSCGAVLAIVAIPLELYLAIRTSISNQSLIEDMAIVAAALYLCWMAAYYTESIYDWLLKRQLDRKTD